MRILRLTLLFVALGWLAFWISRSERARVPAPSAPTIEQAIPKALPRDQLPTLPSPAAPTPGAPRSENAQHARAAPIDVVFENRDGLAVAWGDVILGQVGPDFNRDGGTTQIKPPGRWPLPQIPYVISPQLPHPERVRQAIATLSRESAAQLMEIPGTESIQKIDLIVFEPTPDTPATRDANTSQVCLSALGRTGGAQPIRLAPGCGPPEILHEILHALGFIHEHSRADRDQYVEIHWDRIDPAYQKQFGIVPLEWMGLLAGTRFDPQSIMLYSSDLFSTRPGLPTLTLRNNGGLIPPVTRLSDEDRARIARLWD